MSYAYYGNVRSDAPAQNCGFDPVAAARLQREAMREAVKNIDALKVAADADAQAAAALEVEYSACLTRAAELLPRLLAAQQVAAKSGEGYGKALEAKQKFELEKQTGGV
jgi:hypothetical protein